ncbi:hypothetical protein ACX3O0_05895 [Homoserinimonas sp. A447]
MDIDVLLLNALGFAATAFSFMMWVPQARTTWQNRNDPLRLAGISEATQWLLLIGYLLWGAYGLLIESYWVAAPSAVSMPLALATIILIHRGRRLAPTVRSVSIIAMDEPLSAGATIEASVVEVATASIPIISTETSVAVGDKTPTSSIPILA